MLDIGPAPGQSGALKKEDNVLSLSSDAAQAADAGANAVTKKVAAKPQAMSDATRALITQTLTEEKAEDVVEIDLRGKSEMGDFMVVASGRSTRQVSALADKLIEKLKQELSIVGRVEGKAAGDWVLIDAGDVIVHIFRPEVREFYQLEKMWLDPGDTAASG
ncbi:MAG: ribosome silencing factor [Pseudomonadota bacterium]